jgi:hypothetical protein
MIVSAMSSSTSIEWTLPFRVSPMNLSASSLGSNRQSSATSCATVPQSASLLVLSSTPSFIARAPEHSQFRFVVEADQVA